MLLAQDRTVLPVKEPERNTFSELDVRNVSPPQRFVLKAPEGAPNVVIVLIDDMGFGVPDAFGGPVSMPTLDKLAREGLRYNRFHTSAMCAPTRVALMTGYNHHSNNMGNITEMSTSFPGYTGVRPQTITTMAEVLRQNGYNTAHFGKSHEVPTWEISQSGPQDCWPTRSGFEKFYGFLGPETNQYSPTLYDGVTQVEVPDDQNYHFTTDITNRAISWIKSQQTLTPDKPFFIYFAPGATHAPHHVPKEWIDKQKGKFDQGWDKVREETLERQKKLGIVPENTQLAPKPAAVKNWDNLTDDEKKLFAHQMEVYSAYAEHTDYEIGRLVNALEELGVMDNTVFIYIAGDNGASSEGQLNGMYNEYTFLNMVTETVPEMLQRIDDWGSPQTYPHFAAGWAVAMDAPFTWTKQMASDFGGVRNGMVIRYPKGIREKGEIRTQFCHVIDIAPTIYELAQIPVPKVVNGIAQDPIEGTSFVYSFDEPGAKERHTVQYFEIWGNRAIYKDGWMARTIHRVPWMTIPLNTLQEDKWELYNTLDDYSLSNDLSLKYPDKLKAMQELFMSEAQKYHVLPLDDRTTERFNAALVGRPTIMEGRTSVNYGEGMKGMGNDIFINLRNTSYFITADILVENNCNGVIVCQGGRFGGFSFYIRDGKPSFTYNYLGMEHYNLVSPQPLNSGKHTLTYSFSYDGGGPGKGGTGIILVDGIKLAESRIEKTEPNVFSYDDLADVGTDEGTPVTDYGPSPKFNGKINNLQIEVTGLKK